MRSHREHVLREDETPVQEAVFAIDMRQEGAGDGADREFRAC